MGTEFIFDKEIISIIILLLLFYVVFFIKYWNSKSIDFVDQKIKLIVHTFVAILIMIIVATTSDSVVLGLDELHISESTNSVAKFYGLILYNKMPKWDLQIFVVIAIIFMIVELIILFSMVSRYKIMKKIQFIRNTILLLLVLGCFSDTILVYQAMMMLFFSSTCFDRS